MAVAASDNSWPVPSSTCDLRTQHPGAGFNAGFDYGIGHDTLEVRGEFALVREADTRGDVDEWEVGFS